MTRVFPLALVLALALLSFWLEQAVREESAPASQRRHDPDYMVENFVLTRFNATGAREATLAAAKMVHFPDDGSTELVAPRIEQTKPDQPRLTLRAEHGRLSQDGEEVFLYGDVLVVQEGDAGRAETRFRTSFLHWVGASSLARTDREVTVAAPGRVLSARGMEYHNDSGKLLLRERVRGRFEPRAQRPAAP